MYKHKHVRKRHACPGDAAGMGNAAFRAATTTRTEGLMPEDPGTGGIRIIPVTKRIPIPSADAYTLFRAVGGGVGCILESMEGIPRRAVRSVIGLEPPLLFTLDGDVSCTGDQALGAVIRMPEKDTPPNQIRALLKQFRPACPGTRGFLGGFVGYCSYDMVTDLTGGMVRAGKEGPLARFMLITRGIVYDHVRGSCILFDDIPIRGESDYDDLYARSRERLDALAGEIRDVPYAGPEYPGDPHPDKSPAAGPAGREEYEESVRKAKEHIRAGEIFQVVLSRRISCQYAGDPLDLYGAIRSINPSPYLYYLQFGDEALIGSSPEMLVKVDRDEVQTVPIAGTRPRGRDPGDDERLAADLLSDPKERAEHLMLVDLARNDIGKVAAFGTVRVPEYMEVERFSHVQHIVSRVCGRLREGQDRFDALASCFPAGTVSGAPKIRAMQIIADLETRPRGLYAGGVGYAGFNDELEFAIAIRTLRARGGIVEFSAGAGIVADSVPAREFEETEHKAAAMMKAVEIAGVR